MWVRLDCTCTTHRKLMRAGAEAAWMWVCGLAYANRHTTDGDIPRDALTALYPTDEWTPAKRRKLADKLVAVGLWVGNAFARLAVTALMVVRILASIWVAFSLSGHGGFLVGVLAGGMSVIVLLLLWNYRSDEFFNAS